MGCRTSLDMGREEPPPVFFHTARDRDKGIGRTDRGPGRSRVPETVDGPRQRGHLARAVPCRRPSTCSERAFATLTRLTRPVALRIDPADDARESVTGGQPSATDEA